MTVQFREVTTPVNASAASVTVPKPTGTLTGDLVVLVAYQGSVSDPRYEVPAGFVEVPSAYIGGQRGLQTFVRVATASEPASYVVALPFGSGVCVAGAMSFYSDAAAEMRIEAVATLIEDTPATTRVWPTVEVTSAEQMLVYVGSFSTNTGSTPSAIERWDTFSSPRTYAQTESHTGSGTVGGASATAGVGGTYRNVTIALTEDEQELFAGPQYRATSVVGAGTVDGSQSATIPASVEVGDLLILHLSFSTDRTPTLPAGWEAIPDGLSAGTTSLHSYVKIAEAGDAGATVEATFAAGSITVAMGVHAWYSPRAYELEIEQAANQSNGSSTSHEYPSVTVVAANAGLSYLLSLALGGAVTAPVTAHERYDGGSGAMRLFGMTELGVAGATGTRTSIAGSAAVSRTAVIVVVEVEPEPEPCVSGVGYIFNSVDITDYCNELDLQVAAKELEATHMESAGEEAECGLANHNVRVGGDWSQEVDDLLGPDAMRGTKRSGVAQFTDCPTRVSYSGTAFLTNWQVFTVARGKMGWRAVLRHDGASVRSVVEI